MKKIIKIVTLVVALAGASSTSAQTVYGNNKITDNVYVGVTGGASTPLQFDQVFPLNGFAGLKAGKDLTPVFGFNIEGLAGFGSNGINTRNTVVSTASVGINGTINWSNALIGYNPDRLLNISTETGLSYNHTYCGGGDGADDLGAKSAVIADFKIADPWHVYVEPGVYWNLTGAGDGIQFHSGNAQFALQVGVIYRFKTSNGTHNFKTYDIGWYDYTITKLNEELATKPTEIEVIKEIPGPVVTITDTIYIDRTYTIMFAQDSYELSPIAKAALDDISGSVSITGYASPEGPADYNLTLSEHRAQAVADYLSDRGVNVTSIAGAGVDGETSNRVVVVVRD